MDDGGERQIRRARFKYSRQLSSATLVRILLRVAGCRWHGLHPAHFLTQYEDHANTYLDELGPAPYIVFAIQRARVPHA